MNHNSPQSIYDQNNVSINSMNPPNLQEFIIGTTGIIPPLFPLFPSSLNPGTYENNPSQPSGPEAQMNIPIVKPMSNLEMLESNLSKAMSNQRMLMPSSGIAITPPSSTSFQKKPILNPVRALGTTTAQSMMPGGLQTGPAPVSSMIRKFPSAGNPLDNPMSEPQILNMSFPHPQFNSNFSIYSEPFIIMRTPLSILTIYQSINNGHMQNIQNNFPQTSFSLNNAGLSQQYIEITGPKSQVISSYNQLKLIDLNSDSQWYFLADDGLFQPYNFYLNSLIEMAFINGHKFIELNWNSESYIVNFGVNGILHTQIDKNGHRYVRRGKDTLNQECSIKWYWTNDDANAWNLYKPEACKTIEFYYQQFLSENFCLNFGGMGDIMRKEYANKLSVLVYGTSEFSYKIDFVNMVQSNEKTERWRGIRRGETGGTLRISKFGEKNDPIPWIQHSSS
ncbi:hypothetical protein SteCoe_33222 [Stentor coeruleus]|uniref:WWE domain-containing protein n=1 Tax=Stentor coeruleus TaxID=5963 RepID=A0A1R2AX91_9CILI|nr:hypothetical protein SteCoe_33222 [Stentor coeruleus]